MKKKHGLTVTLASLSAATASIVTGAFVSQSATASTDTPPEASVTVVTAQNGEQPVLCTFDGVALPTLAIGGASDAGSGAGGIIVSSKDNPGTAVGGTLARGGADGTTVRSGSLHVTAAAVEAVEAGGSGVPGVPVVASAEAVPRVFSTDGARAGTPEECAAIEANLPGAGAPPPALAADEPGN